MAILIDQIVTYNDSGIGDNTVPPGIEGLAWCHLVSDASKAELAEFLTEHFATIGCPVENIREPILGSHVTYVGLNTDQRDQALIAGAAPNRRQTVFARCFDYDAQNPPPSYEP